MPAATLGQRCPRITRKPGSTTAWSVGGRIVALLSSSSVSTAVEWVMQGFMEGQRRRVPRLRTRLRGRILFHMGIGSLEAVIIANGGTHVTG